MGSFALCFVIETLSLFELIFGAWLLGKIELGMDSSKTMFFEVMLFLLDAVFGVTFLHNKAPETLVGVTSFDFELLATKLTFFIRLGGIESAR